MTMTTGLANNFGIAETQTEITGKTYRNWVNDVMGWNLDPRITNLVGVVSAPFNYYLAGSVAAYKCPADIFISPLQMAAAYGPRPRSYSMNAYCGAYNPTWGVATAGAGNNFFPSYRQFLRMSQILNAANLYVTLDEHPDSINDGYFLNNADPIIARWPNQNWNDLPASYHNGACGFSFADGHAEIHKWLSGVTKQPVKMQTVTLYPFNNDRQNAYADAEWLATRSSVQR